MAWLEAHQELPRHPKTKRFARMLKISIPQAVGHLFLLWWWALDYAENGDLSKYDAYDLADAVQWDGDPEEFLRAMVECGPGDSCGFVEKDEDGNIFIHDWDKYSGRLVEKREKNRIRKANERKNKSAKKDKKSSKIDAKNSNSGTSSELANTEEIKDNKNVTDMSRATNNNVASESQGYRTQHNTTQHNTTQHNITQQDKTEPTPPPPTREKKSAEAVAEDAEKIKLAEIVSLWNSKLVPLGFSKVLKQTKPREEALNALLSSSPDRDKFRWWQEIFDRISQSEFLRGSGWFTIDWLLNEHNLVKILEGTYNRELRRKSRVEPQNAPDTDTPNSIGEILAKHRAKNSGGLGQTATIDAEYSVVGEGETGDGERSSGFR